MNPFNAIKRAFQAGVPAGDAIKQIITHIEELKEILEAEEINEEDFRRCQNDLGNDFAQLVQVSIESDDNKNKLTRKFLKCPDGRDDYLPSETLLLTLLRNGPYFPPDAQENLSKIINFVLHRYSPQLFENWREVDGVRGVFHLVEAVLERYTTPDSENAERRFTAASTFRVAMSSVISEMLKIDELMDYILFTDENRMQHLFSVCFENAKSEDFITSNDAFKMLKDLVETEPAKGAAYLLANFDFFFEQYNELIVQEAYVTKRQSLKLLCDILENKPYKKVMMKYIALKQNLRLILSILQNRSHAISFEAFHIFKLFLGNPRKVPEIYKDLYRNKDNLQTFIEGFQPENDEENFNHAKRVLLQKLTDMDKTPEEYADYYATKHPNEPARRLSTNTPTASENKSVAIERDPEPVTVPADSPRPSLVADMPFDESNRASLIASLPRLESAPDALALEQTPTPDVEPQPTFDQEAPAPEAAPQEPEIAAQEPEVPAPQDP